MADFTTAHAETMGNEGGYANNPKDAGGETYKGIARKFHPQWRGWAAVDRIKSKLVNMPDYGSSGYYGWCKVLNRTAEQDTALQNMVRDFYLENFWNANRLGEITSQAVANQMYDWAVNTGSRGNKWVQMALDIDPDGSIGPKSIAAINAADTVQLLLRARNYAKDHRLKVCAEHPSQRQFLAGWLKRDGWSDDEVKEIMA